MSIPKNGSCSTRRLAVLAALSSSLLAGCWDDEAAPPAVPGATTITLTGVVATGLAVSGATVNAKCATGTGTATSASDGSYASTLSAGAKLPCALEVTLADGSKLHSVTADAGTSTTTGNDTATSVKAHVTPATELIVAALAGQTPASYFSAFDSAAAKNATEANLTAANAVAVGMLKTGGIDLTSAGNLITAALTAATGTGAGNAYDQALDALKQRLAANGSTLDDLVNGLINVVVPIVPPPTPKPPSSVPSLPGDLLLVDSADSCKALRSTTYRVAIPQYSGDLASQTTQLSIDAKTLKVTNMGSGVVDTWQANGDCRFIANAGTSAPVDVVVTPAGLLVGRPYIETESKYRLAVGFPEQEHTLAELAGDWNGMGRELLSGTGAADATYAGFTGDLKVDSAGAVTAGNFCVGTLSTCSPQTDAIVFSLNIPSTGGFDMSIAGSSTRRAYAYRAGGGEMLVLAYGPSGSFNLWTRKADGSLPAAGSVGSYWGFPSNTNGVAGTLADSAFTHNAGSGNSYTRVSLLDGHTETLQINTPRSGYAFRAQGTATNSANATVTVNEFTALGLRGMGLSALWIPAQGTGGGVYLSPSKPTDTGHADVAHDLLGRSYAPTCAALRSGTYRIVRLHNGSAETLTGGLNAATLAWGGSASPSWVPSATEACRFSDAATGMNDIVVSQAGVITQRVNDAANNVHWMMMAFPEQSHTLAELAGDWNVIGLQRNSAGNGYNGITATASVDAAGAVTAATWCEDEASRSVAGDACLTVTAGLPTHVVNTAGGFDVSSGGQLFLYASATGKMVMKVDPDGSVQIRTPVQTLSAKVGQINKQWDVSVNSVMDANADVGLSSFTHKAYDAATGKLTRTSNDDGHEQVVMLNSPRAGFSHRAPIADAPTTNPVGTVQVREFTALNLREAAGITAQWRPQLMADQVATNARGRLQISVQVP